MPATGVTPQGFVLKTVDDLISDVNDDIHANTDAGLDLDPDQPIAQINSANMKKVAELWEIAQVLYNSFNRQAAEDRLLDNIGALTGTTRVAAKKSTVVGTVNLNSGFDKAAGTMFANVVGQPDTQFTNQAEVIASTGAGNYTVTFVAVADGAVVANAGTLTQISTSISGWNSITNPADAIVGAPIETNEAYRVRQVTELTADGGTTVDAIRAHLQNLQDGAITNCTVFENVTLFTNSDGLPAKAIECCIYDGIVPSVADTLIAQTIWDQKGSGVQTFGTSSAIAIDSKGDQQLVYFSRAVVDSVYLEFDVNVSAVKFPGAGAGQAAIKAAVALQGNQLALGDEVVALFLRSVALGACPGIVDVPAIRLGYAASPVGTSNLITNSRHIAKFDTTRILVNLV